ncbi:MAG TPA: ATP-grasp domain-containing protein [Candidatus Gracilibacteria bacterium]
MNKIIRPKTIIFTGFEHKQEHIKTAKDKGFFTVLLTLKERGKEAEIFDEVIEVDFYKKAEVDKLIPLLKQKFNTKAIISNYEKFVVPRSYIAEKLGVVSTSVYGACCSRNKILQRYALSVMPENIPWKKYQTTSGLKKAFKTLGPKVFLKFISGVKSRCIYYVENEEALVAAWEEFSQALDNLDLDFQEDYKYLDFRFDYPDPRKHFLIEKAIQGEQVTVASFVGSHQVSHMPSVCDVYPAHMVGRDDSFLAFRILPSKHSDFLVQEAQKVTETATQILGLRYCGIHSELIITPEKEIKIIEIASRIGGYRERMYRQAYGISLSQQLMNAAIGKAITPNRKPQKYVSVIELFPVNKGTFASVSDPHKHLESADEFKIKATKGQPIGPAREGFSPVAWVMITGKTYEDVYQKSLAITQECEIVVEG